MYEHKCDENITTVKIHWESLGRAWFLSGSPSFVIFCKLCPFCGKKLDAPELERKPCYRCSDKSRMGLFTSWNAAKIQHKAICDTCGISSGLYDCETDAIREWNYMQDALKERQCQP